jgi:glycosyltransferase involved in cell wall biosynthesis
MKICLISPIPPPYGGIAHWTAMIHHFVQRHTTVELLQVDTAPRWRNIYDHAAYKRILGGGLQFVRDHIALLVALRKKPNVIHLTTSGSFAVLRDFAICLTARLWRKPVVYHIRFGRIPEIAATNTFEWRVLARTMQMVTIVIAITPDTAEAIEHYLPDICVEYIPNPIDLSELPKPQENAHNEPRTALFLGWILPTKGVEELLQAWAQLCPIGWELLCLGPGEAEYIQSLINRYNPSNCKFLGELAHDDAMQLLAKSDLFVLPSHTEGFPNVVLEAMALGKPIVATTVGAIPEILSDDCGILIKPKDVNELTEALSKMMRDETLRHGFGEKANKKVRQEYSIDVVFARYMHIWERIV